MFQLDRSLRSGSAFVRNRIITTSSDSGTSTETPLSSPSFFRFTSFSFRQKIIPPPPPSPRAIYKSLKTKSKFLTDRPTVESPNLINNSNFDFKADILSGEKMTTFKRTTALNNAELFDLSLFPV